MRDSLKDRWLTLALTFYALSLAVWPLIAAMPVTIEDGFYYLKIAQNVVAGAGSTFDGLHPANGYHPLWLLCLLPVFAVASDPEQALLFAALLQSAMAAASAAILFVVAPRLAGRVGATATVLLWIHLSHRLWLDGLEHALQLLTLTATLLFFLRRFGASGSDEAKDLKAYLGLGIGCSLCFLARLDSILLSPILGLWVLAIPLRNEGLARPTSLRDGLANPSLANDARTDSTCRLAAARSKLCARTLAAGIANAFHPCDSSPTFALGSLRRRKLSGIHRDSASRLGIDTTLLRDPAFAGIDRLRSSIESSLDRPGRDDR